MDTNTVCIQLLCVLILMNLATEAADQCSDGNTISFETFKPFSFRYPESGKYSQNLNCSWLFNGGAGNSIYSRVANSYVDCGDTLKTYDGNSLTSDVLEANGCSSPPGSTKNGLVTTQNYLLVNFVTDGSTFDYETGFTIEMISGNDQSQASQACTAVGVQLSATSEDLFLTSPNFPNKFVAGTECQWLITAENPSATVSIDVHFLDMDEYNNVCYDKLKIVEGGNVKETLCGRNRFNVDKSYTSTGGSVTIQFTAGTYGPFHGFTLSYRQNVPATTTSTTKATTTQITKTSTTVPTTTTTTSEATTTQTTTPVTSTTVPTTTSSTSESTTTQTTATVTSTTAMTCGENEKFSLFVPGCPLTCRRPYWRRSCGYHEGCKCKLGYVRDDNLKCIRRSSCCRRKFFNSILK